EKFELQKVLVDQVVDEGRQVAGRLQDIVVTEVEDVGDDQVVATGVEAGDLRDLRNGATAAGEPVDLHHDVECRGDLPLNRDDRQVDRHQHQHFQPLEHVLGAVGVDGRHRAVVPGVHRLEHVERLRPAALADENAVGPHAERVLHQVANGV